MASGTGAPSPSSTRQASTTRSPLACGPAMQRTEEFSVVSPKEKKGPTVCEGVGPKLISSLERSRLGAAQNNVELVAQRPLRLRGFQIELADHALSRLFIRNGLVDRIKCKQGIAGKIHLRDQARNKGPAKNREVNVGWTPRVEVIEPGISARLDRDKTICAVLVGKGATGAGKIGIEWRGVLVFHMNVTPRRVRLPNLNQGTRYRTSVAVQHTSRHNDSFTPRLISMLARKVVIGFGDFPVSIDGARDLRQSMRKKDQRLGWCAPHGRAVGFVQRRRLAAGLVSHIRRNQRTLVSQLGHETLFRVRNGGYYITDTRMLSQHETFVTDGSRRIPGHRQVPACNRGCMTLYEALLHVDRLFTRLAASAAEFIRSSSVS